MRLELFKTLWGHIGTRESAILDAVEHGFDGIEGPVPEDAAERKEWSARLSDHGLRFIAEICTAGSYVPRPGASVAEHLESFRQRAGQAVQCAPLFLTSLAGSDAWPLAESVDFFGRAMEIAERLGVVASFETHRSRSTFHPWVTAELVRQLPGIRLTCDFSHWCCVTERLVLDTDPELLPMFLPHAYHIHARVGYDQGPQVPHPAAPEYAAALQSHEGWWDAIWNAQELSGRGTVTMTPEFGPDGYLHTLPFTAAPVADLGEINRWMAARQRARFSRRSSRAAA